MRCKGRLGYSELGSDTREPIILPKEHPLTLLEIQECHARVLHIGVRSTLAELRSRVLAAKGEASSEIMFLIVASCARRWRENRSVCRQRQVCQIFE